jgi:uncharacterized membrane protein (DUF373 family)
VSGADSRRDPVRTFIAKGFTAAEDVVYIGLGIVLAASAVILLVSSVVTFAQTAMTGSLPSSLILLLDRILLVLLIVELLYTVQVSFREHALVPEPFLLVGLIAGIRRVLVLTAEFGEMRDRTEEVFRHFMIELLVLTVLIVAITVSLVVLRKKGSSLVAERA